MFKMSAWEVCCLPHLEQQPFAWRRWRWGFRLEAKTLLAVSNSNLHAPPCAGALTSQKDAAWQPGCFSGLLALPGPTKSEKSQQWQAPSVGFLQLAV